MSTATLPDLSQFYGSENVYRLMFAPKLQYVVRGTAWGNLKVCYTDGVKYLADHAQCHWLLSEIAMGLEAVWKKVKTEAQRDDFTLLIWELIKDKDGNGAVLVGRADKREYFRNKILFTDFPFPDSGKFALWSTVTSTEDENIINIILPSEY